VPNEALGSAGDRSGLGDARVTDRPDASGLLEYLDLVEARFGRFEPSIHSCMPEPGRFARLRAEAESLERRHAGAAPCPPLFGSLVGLKDIFRADGFPTQAGSRLPVEAFAGPEAECVSRLKNAGALVLGKTVTTEFALFSPGPTRNPHNPEHTPGGSSSGSAAAVAAGFCQLALGTQTIGSTIRPASFCGVVGFKPTYDRVSRAGVIPLAPSLDHVGILALDLKAARQAALILFESWKEPTALPRRPRLGVPAGPYLQAASHEGLAFFATACRRLQDAGYEIEYVPLMSDFDEIRARNDLILCAEAAIAHADWFAEHGDLYSERFADVVRRGRSVAPPQLEGALAARDEFRAELEQAFVDNGVDLWICPATVGPAPKGLASTGDPVMNLPWSQAGLPAVGLPVGKSSAGLPMGLQVVGAWNADESLLAWAQDLLHTAAGRAA
jgi:Asp-tRNA(Asn)/Glu-tRNA(Gln) amidotransferase A subunit family amidase